MRNLVLAITGSGMTISGILLFSLLLSGLDWKRINSYGIFHEICLYGPFFEFIFIAAMAFVALGTLFLIISIISSLTRAEQENVYEV